MSSKNAHKMHGMASFRSDLFRAIPQDGDEFLNHTARKTGDETWDSFVKAKTKDQSKQWMHTHHQTS
jgi:hypothetical protein